MTKKSDNLQTHLMVPDFDHLPEVGSRKMAPLLCNRCGADEKKAGSEPCPIKGA